MAASAFVTSPLTAIELKDRLYLRPAEVIKATGISRSVVYQALLSGTLRGVRVGRSWVVPLDAVHEWLSDSPDNRTA